MFLPLPDILRFKGKNAPAFCDLWETALHGRCKREGNTLVLREGVKVQIDLGSSTTAVPPFGFQDAMHEHGRNGRQEAQRA